MTDPLNILISTFSPDMLPCDADCADLRFERVSRATVIRMLAEERWFSAIRHPLEAQLLTELLGREIPVRKRSIRMEPGTRLIVAKLPGRVAVTSSADWTDRGVAMRFFTVTYCQAEPLPLAA